MLKKVQFIKTLNTKLKTEKIKLFKKNSFPCTLPPSPRDPKKKRVNQLFIFAPNI